MRCACYRGRLSAPAISRRRPRQGRCRDQVPLRSICPPVWTVRCAVLKRSTSMFSALYCVEQGRRRLQTCCKVPVRLQLWHQKHSEISAVDKQRQHRRWFCATIGGRYYNHTCFSCQNERVRRVKAAVADVHDVWPNVTCPNATTVVNESLSGAGNRTVNTTVHAGKCCSFSEKWQHSPQTFMKFQFCHIYGTDLRSWNQLQPQ